jgi:nucleoside 2-deoxyribosyltransferase
MAKRRIYLAGPEVFLPKRDAKKVFDEKRRLCSAYRFIGVSPVDNDLDPSAMAKRDAALRISAANEDMMRSCHLVIANLTPFRGPSADVGTAYECGFMRALGKPVLAYTNVAGTLLERTRQALRGKISRDPSRDWRDSFRMVVEDFDCFDNLMLVGAVEATGAHVVVNATPVKRRFTDLTGFETCLQLARELMPTKRAGARRRSARPPDQAGAKVVRSRRR